MTETISATEEQTTTVIHRAFKFCLDPNERQETLLFRNAGSARFAYNMMIAYNAEVDAKRKAYWKKRKDEEATDAEIKKELTALAKEDSSYKTIGFQKFATEQLSPEITRHREAAKAIAEGADPEEVWPSESERSSEPWLHTVPRRVLVSGLQSADKAWKNFFDSRTGARAGKLMGTPKFKSRSGSRDSFTIPSPEAMGGIGEGYHMSEPEYTIRLKRMKRNKRKGRPTIVDYRHVRLSHLGVIRTHDTTKDMAKAVKQGGQVRSYTVSRSADRWYVSFLVEMEMPIAKPTRAQKAAGAVGVDLGVKYMAALSDPNAPERFKNYPELEFTGDGSATIKNPRWAKASEKRITKLQRKLARQQKGSNRWKVTKKKLAHEMHLVALRRESTLHQVSKRLATGYTLIGIEDLGVAGMTASAAGTIEEPGKNVRQKAGLNKAILDVSFGTLRRQVEYKAPWYGSEVQTIDRFFPSSQICSACGERVTQKLNLSDRTYKCEHCGETIDRDVNAARNIGAEAVRLHKEAAKKQD